MNKFTAILIGVVILALFVLANVFFTVDESQQAIVVRLGKPNGEVRGPGLHPKIPFLDDVRKFERRLMDIDAASAEILTADKKNLVVDNYAKWRIVDPLTFYTSVRDVRGALSRLDDIIYAEVRVELGRHIMSEIISKKRAPIMVSVTERSNAKAAQYGISVTDVRIKRADLPKENERAVFGRMRTERERQAKKYRSEGQEESIKIKADAERQRAVILAEAYRQSETLRGQGDAEATKVYAAAFNADPEFYAFVRALEAYRKSLTTGSTILLNEDNSFLKYFKDTDR